MDDNKLLMIVLAFILGLMASKMMKNMCGGRLVEGAMYVAHSKGLGQPCSFGECKWDLWCNDGNCDECHFYTEGDDGQCT